MEFPTPSHPPPSTSAIPILPQTIWANTTPEATETMLRLLKDNHQNYHLFFSANGEGGLHNHAAHGTLTLWALGAQKNTLEAAYDKADHREVLEECDEDVTKENWVEHLGDPKFYKGYLGFFKKELARKSIPHVLEEYIFSLEANYDEGEEEVFDSPFSALSESSSSSSSSSEDEGKRPDKKPRDGADVQFPRGPKKGMYCRLYDGLMHAFIHLGCGLEMGLPGLLAEGLAAIAIHQANTFSTIFPPSWWEPTPFNSYSSTVSGKETHAFDVLSRMSTDTRLKFRRRFALHPKAVVKNQEVLREYAAQWTFDSGDPEVVKRKVEELVWLNVVLYGAGGFISEAEFRADFYLMHLVTSSIFLGTVISQLRPAHQEICLRGYLITTLCYWSIRGRPIPNIRALMAAHHPCEAGPGSELPSSPLLSPKNQLPDGADHVTQGSDRTKAEEKLWEDLLKRTMTLPDDHLPKLQRALSHFAKAYGGRKAGEGDFKGTELAGAECLDGSLFVRTAALTMKRLLQKGVKEYSATGSMWDHKAF